MDSFIVSEAKNFEIEKFYTPSAGGGGVTMHSSRS